MSDSAARAIRTACVIALVTACGVAHAERKEIGFSDRFCSYSLTFDPAKTGEPRLRGTIDLLYSAHPESAVEYRLFRLQGFTQADVDAEKSWCDAEPARLAALPLLDLAGLEERRRQAIAELVDRCHLLSARIQAAEGNVSALKGYAPAAPACTGFAEALDRSDKEFVEAWNSWTAKRCPEAPQKDLCEKSAHEIATAPDSVRQMRREMLAFGWYNCANHYSLRNRDYDAKRGGGSRLRLKVLTLFEKNMKVVETTCGADD